MRIRHLKPGTASEGSWGREGMRRRAHHTIWWWAL